SRTFDLESGIETKDVLTTFHYFHLIPLPWQHALIPKLRPKHFRATSRAIFTYSFQNHTGCRDGVGSVNLSGVG
ncbi:MAG: hypothetical protein ABJC12_07165, partial [Saprospiraceae bacterium]